MLIALKYQLMAGENNLYGLAYCCPYLQRKDDCPFIKMEDHSFKEKMTWLDNLSKMEKDEILEHHRACSRIKKIEI